MLNISFLCRHQKENKPVIPGVKKLYIKGSPAEDYYQYFV